MTNIFEQRAKQNTSSNIFEERSKKVSLEQQPIQQPITLKGTAGAYASGVAAGAGGLPKDILNLLEPAKNFSPTIQSISNLAKSMKLKNTHELKESLQQQGPQNALERILEKSGEFGGQEALLGTAAGGPIGAGLGLAHGSISGTFYGAAKELGASDEVALLAALATVSPIAAERLISKLKTGKEAKRALKSQVEEVKDLAAKEAVPVGGKTPTPPPPAGIGPGSVLPQTKSAFNEKEDIIKKLAEGPKGSPLGVEVKLANTKAEAPSLQGRISEAPELGRVISKEPFETEASAGREISKDIKQSRDIEKEIVKEKYKKAEEITAPHNDIYPNLAKENEDRISKLENLEKRSAGEEAVYQDAITLRKMIGTPDALIEANASRLMKQANSFSQKVNYELPYAGYKGAIKEIVHQMNDAVISSLESAGKAASLVREADKTFSRYADRFMGDEVAPYFQKKILNPEQLARKAVSDEATHRAIKNAIGSRNAEVVNKIDRELVHQKMDKYSKDPSLVNSKEYIKDLKNISERIGKEKTADIDLALREKQIANERKLLNERKLKETQLAREKIAPKQAAKPLSEKIHKEPIAKNPEQIDKLFRSRSDIRRLRREMKDKGLEKEFEKLAEQKIEEIFKEGGFGSKKVTGIDLKRIINKEHEILSELMGEEELSILYKASEIAGKEELTVEIVKQVLKSAGKLALQFVGLGKIIKLIPLRHI